MMRRLKVVDGLYTICFLFVVSILLFIDIKISLKPIKVRRNEEIVEVKNENDTTQKIHKLDDDSQVTLKVENIPEITKESHFFGVSDLKSNTLSTVQDEIHSNSTITNLLEKTRFKIKWDTYNYTFSQSGVRGLENLVMETGGKPLISLVVSTWRSGSTFTADLINHVHPSTYYLDEPLRMFGNKQFRTLKEASEALSVVKRMLKCNYKYIKGLDSYYKSRRKHFAKRSRKPALWKYCNYEGHDDLCYDVEVISRLCKLFPFQNVKLERLRLQLVEEILKDKELNVKVILLVRDPRGVMQSRRHEKFCNESSDCRDPSMLCTDMISDYAAAGRLLPQYPDRLIYRELCLGIIGYWYQLPHCRSSGKRPIVRISSTPLSFGLSQDVDGRNVKRTLAFDEFLQSHTNIEVAGAHATSRISRNVPYKWRTLLSFNNVNEIQMSCREAMRMWGYKMAHNETHLKSKDFNPVEGYTIL